MGGSGGGEGGVLANHGAGIDLCPPIHRSFNAITLLAQERRSPWVPLGVPG